MRPRLRAVVGGSFIIGTFLLGAGPARAQTGEADLVAGTPSISPPPAAGGSSISSVGVTNSGPDATTNVRIQITFNLSGDDTWLTIGSASVMSGSCNIAGPRSVLCIVPALAAGDSVGVDISFSLAPEATGTIIANGLITSDLLDPIPDNFTSTGQLPVTPTTTTTTNTTTTTTATTTTTTTTTTTAPPPPPPTAPPATDPQVVTTAPRPEPTPETVATTDPEDIPTTGTPAPAVVGLGLAGLVAGLGLVLLGRRWRTDD